LYAGAGHWGDGVLVWQMGRAWSDLTGPASERSAGLFSALANPHRVRIVAELLQGRLATAELARRLDQPSSGQLFHHLKELLAAGVVHQPVRGTYAIAEHRVIPLLALLSAALDVGAGQNPDPAPTADQGADA
jgi:DNA-binding transcriptional ArsR family regulator